MFNDHSYILLMTAMTLFLFALSGGFCKDQVYLEGALQILKNRRHIDFHLLVQLGKISWEDIDKLQLLGNLDDTKVPFFMQDLAAYHSCLDKICESNGLTQEVLESVWMILYLHKSSDVYRFTKKLYCKKSNSLYQFIQFDWSLKLATGSFQKKHIYLWYKGEWFKIVIKSYTLSVFFI